MPKHLTYAEQTAIDVVARYGKSIPWLISRLSVNPLIKGVGPAARCIVYRLAKGIAHRRGAPERRGRHAALSRGNMSDLDHARKRLLKRSLGQRA